jgi:hypothetical protein
MAVTDPTKGNPRKMPGTTGMMIGEEMCPKCGRAGDLCSDCGCCEDCCDCDPWPKAKGYKPHIEV